MDQIFKLIKDVDNEIRSDDGQKDDNFNITLNPQKMRQSVYNFEDKSEEDDDADIDDVGESMGPRRTLWGK